MKIVDEIRSMVSGQLIDDRLFYAVEQMLQNKTGRDVTVSVDPAVRGNIIVDFKFQDDEDRMIFMLKYG